MVLYTAGIQLLIRILYRPFLSTGLYFRGFCYYFLSTNLKANEIISKHISKQQYCMSLLMYINDVYFK